MADIQRGLGFIIEDLDRRARPGRSARNQPIQKYTSVADTVYVSSDTVTTTVETGPYYWHPAASSSQSLIWGMTAWSTN